MGRLSTTHTYVELEISAEAYDEIAAKLKAADYSHAVMEDGAIDMHGIGLTKKPATNPGPADLRRYAWAKDSPAQDLDFDPCGR